MELHGEKKNWSSGKQGGRKQHHTRDGSSAVLNIALEMEGEKRKKELLQQRAFEFGHGV